MENPQIWSQILNVILTVLLAAVVILYIRSRDRVRELDDLNKLRKIADLHKDGILDDDEFKAKKSELLSRV